MKILILASNPRRDLNLDDEIRDLRDAIERSTNRQQFEVEHAPAVRVGDLQDLLFKHRPQIVHFCGHGSGEQGLVFKGKDGGEQWVRAEALSDLFRLFSKDVSCVLLNACYSEEQANAIVNHIDCVIGMNQEIRDDAAIAFSKGFYRALGYDCSIQQAYEFGKNAIQLEISGSSRMRSVASEITRKAELVDATQSIAIPEHLKPILKMKQTPTSDLTSGLLTDLPLNQDTRTTIQLEIDESLVGDSKIKQYRDRVKEFLSDHRLSTLEEMRLERLRKDLSLSIEEANRILLEEQEPLHKAQEEYKEMLIRLIEEGHYPFDEEISRELQQLRHELSLTDSEVETISKLVFEAAKDDVASVISQANSAKRSLENVHALEQAGQQKVEQLQARIDLVEQKIQLNITVQLKDALKWLADKKKLSTDASEYVFRHQSRMQSLSEEDKEQFCWEIEKYLEILYHSVLTVTPDLLDEPPVMPSFKEPEAYKTAFNFIKGRIPSRIPKEVHEQIGICFDYLFDRLIF